MWRLGVVPPHGGWWHCVSFWKVIVVGLQSYIGAVRHTHTGLGSSCQGLGGMGKSCYVLRFEVRNCYRMAQLIPTMLQCGRTRRGMVVNVVERYFQSICNFHVGDGFWLLVMAWHIGFNGGGNGHDVGLSEGGGGGPHVQASVNALSQPWRNPSSRGGNRCGLWGYVSNFTPIV